MTGVSFYPTVRNVFRMPLLKASSPLQPMKTAHMSSGFSLDLPKDLAEELIQLFFKKVQPWLPLLHRPRFQARYMNASRDSLSRLHGYSLDEALLFYGMFALSARFSNHPALVHVDPSQRGNALAVKAREICDKGRLDLEPSSLLYLQGCILLAFYMYACGPYPQGWILTGVCVRMAYELGIGTLDADPIEKQLDESQWSADEELRRVWWLVWELDTFGSTISRRPYSIDWHRMKVKLPVSDEVWFSNTVVQSAVLRTKPSETWKTLRDTENQDERAWFLVANYLTALTNDLVHANDSIPEKELEDLSNAITCFALALPRRLRLEQTASNSSSSSCSNFIVSIHLMITTTRHTLHVYSSMTRSKSCSTSSINSIGDLPSPYQDYPRIISRWSPEHITICHPFIACIMLSRNFGSSTPTYNDSSDDGLLEDMAALVISRFAENWQIGNILLKIFEITKRKTLLPDEDKDLAKRFTLYFPSKATKSPSSPTKDLEQQENSSIMEISMTPRRTNGVIESERLAENASDSQSILNFAEDHGHPSTMVDQGFDLWPGVGDFFYGQETNLDLFPV